MQPFVTFLARKLFKAAGVSAVKAGQTYEADRIATLRRHHIDLVIDVGANVGQYAKSLREFGYDGAIVSLEPLPAAFAKLQQSMSADKKWQGLNVGAGSTRSQAMMNVSSDSVCSSFLLPSDIMLETIPSSRIVDTVKADVVPLDELSLPEHKNASLKIDVQGFEKEVLRGAGRLLDCVRVLEIELSLKASYQHGYTLVEAVPKLTDLGFKVTSIGRGVTNPNTGQLIDLDVLLER